MWDRMRAHARTLFILCLGIVLLTLGACKGGTDNPVAPTILEPPSFQLTVSKTGSGNGLITSSPPGINCGGDCSGDYSAGTIVSLTATPASGSTFAGWSGDPDCSSGRLTMSADRSCTATFNEAPAMVIRGTAATLDRKYEIARTSVRVSASAQTGPPCASADSASDGAFSVEVPSSCADEGQPIMLRVNNQVTCISVAYRAGRTVMRTLFGRPTGFCGMVLKGRAGYLADTLGPGSPKQFTGVFVGAWRGGYAGSGGGIGCVQTLGTADGSYLLQVPESCFSQLERVYLTAGGLPTCVTVPFRRVTVRRDVTLFGRRSACN